MPSNLFLNEQEDRIIIEIYYKVKRNSSGSRFYTILSKEEGKKAISSSSGDVDVLTSYWSHQTWQLNNSIIRESLQFNKISGTNEIDWALYQNKMIQYCLKEWNVTDGQGNPVPPTLENVGLLPTVIVGAMVREYDKITKADDEEKKG